VSPGRAATEGSRTIFDHSEAGHAHRRGDASRNTNEGPITHQEVTNDRRTIMVNTQLFQTARGPLLPAADARNHEGAPAYALTPRHQLAQLAATDA
jgi:hypothetical protein